MGGWGGFCSTVPKTPSQGRGLGEEVILRVRGRRWRVDMRDVARSVLCKEVGRGAYACM